MFKKILVANRGEIALRIMKTLREMDISTVSVHSDADINAAHRLFSDQSVYIGKSAPKESYLNMAAIIKAAKETGAEAIHPGYGFLSENADFAALCEKKKIVFIGPPAHVIKNLGDKTIARQIMIKSNVPVTPGMSEPETDISSLMKKAEELGYPVLIKAAAGGGGKGMRIVFKETDMKDACEAAEREASQAFGNGSIYLEKYLLKPRHVEIQILADTHGHVIHLLERECSIQRRYQKIIEESPSSALSDELRQAMGKAAVSAAKAAGYVNAGTVEFLLDMNNQFYFLEVNTRLQVEHPVTEMITGIDLVKHQIRIAAGEKLTLSQKDISAKGHAIECRIYGEDPENAFFPSPGKILFMKEPKGPGIRNDCGIYSGYTVPVEYDPILSKLVVHAENRELAIQRMIQALKDYVILGIKTPIPFLIDIMNSDAFKKGDTTTDFIDTHFPAWKPDKKDTALAYIAFIADELSKTVTQNPQSVKNSDFPTPWETIGFYRP
ncbi:MAG: acetyl-CoA carboxylase biotin carboxylase subunit [Proteobacteria bacterium]|nr:acetyl-CoA carboxylase biotin carboxylase subunit [Pseudomonadota bacterium]